MTLKIYRPSSPGMRGLILVDRKGLWRGRPEKTLTVSLKSSGGRNAKGRITAYHRGGGHKKLYRLMDFKRKDSVVVERIEYDPNRSAFIALTVDPEGKKKYVLAPQGIAPGAVMCSGEGADAVVGSTMPLRQIPTGSFVHSIELTPGRGAQIARSAGVCAQVVGQDDEKYTLIRLPSKELRKINSRCLATLGGVSNPDHKNRSLGKAGRRRWMGWRPHVRGVAMNPVDHPHGGGEGKSSGGRHPVTPWGVSTKGKKTRKKKSSDALIVRRS
jgi:large subunit ribosomal protein L2